MNVFYSYSESCILFLDAQRARCSVPLPWGRGAKGVFSFQREYPLWNPQRKARGVPLDSPTLSVWCLNNYTRCATADNRRESSRIATPNAALPLAGILILEAKGLFKPETANLNAFLLDGHTARFLSRERKWGVWSCRPQATLPSAPVRNLTARVRAIS